MDRSPTKIVNEEIRKNDMDPTKENFQMRPHQRIFLLGIIIVLSVAAVTDTAQSTPREVDLISESHDPQQTGQMPASSLVTLSFRNVSIAEAFEMLSKKERVNIILKKSVTGNISLNLYDVTLEEAIHAIAEAGGYGVTQRYQGYVIHPPKPDTAGNSSITKTTDTIIRTFKLQYANPNRVKEMLAKHVTGRGKVTALAERKIVVVEDTQDSITRLEKLLAELDKQPQQILIEAKILEITLTDTEKFGLDWSKLFAGWSADTDDTRITLSAAGLTNSTSGFLFSFTSTEITAALNALSSRGRVLTLSTPKLLTIENQEASVVIGDRQGYKVTTTIDQVTTESIEFLESGIILRVTPSVDKQGRIFMRIHPEVSTGTISFGIPAQTTTSITTELFTNDGQPVFIAGLIRNTTEHSRSGIPLLSAIPFIGNLFSNIDEKVISTETVVLITPHIINDAGDDFHIEATQKLNKVEEKIKEEKVWTRDLLE